jgi:phosphate:Na+ symporter
MRKEVNHLQDNAVKLIAHGLNLHRHEIYATDDVAETIENSTQEVEFDIDEKFEQRVKTLYSAIVDFASRAGALNLPRQTTDHIYDLRDAAQRTVHAVKAIKHLRPNVTKYTRYPQGTVTDIYNGLRAEIARILIEINKLEQRDPEDRSTLWLEEERVQIERDRKNTTRMIEGLIRDGKIDAGVATSFLTDSGYAYEAMNDLIKAAKLYYEDTEDAMAEVERILMLEDEDIEQLLSEVVEAEEVN